MTFGSVLVFLSLGQTLSAPFSLTEVRSGTDSQVSDYPSILSYAGAPPLVVWRSGRSNRMLFATRLDPQLGAIDVPALALPMVNPLYGQAATNGSTGLVVESNTSAIHVAALAPAGTLLTSPVALTQLGAGQLERLVALAWDDATSRWLVAWGRHGVEHDVHGAIVSADGGILVPDFLIAASPQSASRVAATSTDGGFFVVWEDDRLSAGAPSLVATNVSASGVAGAEFQPAPPAAGITQRLPALARSSTGEVVLVWAEAMGSAPSSVMALRNPASGTHAPVTIAPATSPYHLAARFFGQSPDVLIAYTNSNGGTLRARRFAGDDSVSAELVTTVASGLSATLTLALEASGSSGEVLAVVQRRQGAGPNLVALQLASADPPIVTVAPQLVSWSSEYQTDAVAAYDGRSYLAAWRVTADAAERPVQLQMLEPATGRRLLGDAGQTLDLRATTNATALAGNELDAGFLVGVPTTSDGGGVSARRLSGSGTLLDSAPLWLPIGQSAPSLVWSDQSYAVLSVGGNEVRLSRLNPDGSTKLPLTPVFTARGSLLAVSAAALQDTICFAAFGSNVGSDAGLGLDAGADIVVGIVWPDGGVRGFEVPSRAGEQLNPKVVAGTSTFFVLWYDGPSPGPGRLQAVRVDPTGAMLDPTPLDIAAGQSFAQPQAAWTGRSFAVIVQTGNDITVTEVTESGTVLAPAGPLRLLNGAGIITSFIATAGASGEVLLTMAVHSSNILSGALPGSRAHGQLLFFDAGFDPDAGSSADAGLVDAGTPDLSDAGTPDLSDAGTPDLADAGTPDLADAGTSDGGDAGTPDLADAGTPDGGDAGTPDGGALSEIRLRVGCGCGSGQVEQLSAMLVALALRRRCRHSRLDRQGSSAP